MTYLAAAAATGIGAFIQSVTGMGYGMICMAALTMFFPYLPVMTAVKCLTTVFMIPIICTGLRRKIFWHVLWLPVLFSIIGNYFALKFLDRVNEPFLKVFLGMILFGIALFYLMNTKQIRIQPSLFTGAAVGTVTGFFCGMSGVAGPPVALYYLSTKKLADDMEAYYATTIVTFMMISLYQMGELALRKAVPEETGKYILIGLVPTVIGNIFGRFFSRKVNPQFIRKAVYLVMLFMGVVLVIANWRNVSL